MMSRMWFSATASFAASGGLAALGAASVARNRVEPLRMFAAIPLLFAAQQAAEGVVWLTIHHAQDPRAAGAHGPAVVSFLAFALCLWPTWLPFSLSRAEPSARRRRALRWLFACGVAVAAFAVGVLVHGVPRAHVVGHSIGYEYDFPFGGPAFLPDVGYAIPTIVPFFVSSLPLTRAMGVLLSLAMALTLAIERYALTSVWCFFAAILSGMILLIVARSNVSA
jgi:hypothetical protein